MKTVKKCIFKHGILLSLLLVLAVMAMIFVFSSQNAEASHQSSNGIVQWLIGRLFRDYSSMTPTRQHEIREAVSFLVRKTAHFIEYALLGFSLFLHITAIMTRCRVPGPKRLSLGIGTLYAATDELHQIFVCGRAGAVADVILDAIGVLAGIYCLALLLKSLERKRNRDQKGRGERISPE